MNQHRNVYGTPLALCSLSPKTGFYRTGDCRTDSEDSGRHGVCAEMTDAFLIHTRVLGNDLSTPAPAYGFPGLKPGDRWCLCAVRWKEALEAGVAPPVILDATHESVLEVIGLSELETHRLD